MYHICLNVLDKACDSTANMNNEFVVKIPIKNLSSPRIDSLFSMLIRKSAITIMSVVVMNVTSKAKFVFDYFEKQFKKY